MSSVISIKSDATQAPIIPEQSTPQSSLPDDEEDVGSIISIKSDALPTAQADSTSKQLIIPTKLTAANLGILQDNASVTATDTGTDVTRKTKSRPNPRHRHKLKQQAEKMRQAAEIAVNGVLADQYSAPTTNMGDESYKATFPYGTQEFTNFTREQYETQKKHNEWIEQARAHKGNPNAIPPSEHGDIATNLEPIEFKFSQKQQIKQQAKELGAHREAVRRATRANISQQLETPDGRPIVILPKAVFKDAKFYWH